MVGGERLYLKVPLALVTTPVFDYCSTSLAISLGVRRVSLFALVLLSLHAAREALAVQVRSLAGQGYDFVLQIPTKGCCLIRLGI